MNNTQLSVGKSRGPSAVSAHSRPSERGCWLPEAGPEPRLASGCNTGTQAQAPVAGLAFEALCSSLLPQLITRDNGAQPCPLPAPSSGRGWAEGTGRREVKRLPVCLWAQEALLVLRSSLF